MPAHAAIAADNPEAGVATAAARHQDKRREQGKDERVGVTSGLAAVTSGV
jgi:hypothetical protein